MPKWPPSSRRASLSGPNAEGTDPAVAVRVALHLVRAYQLVMSPLAVGACRFHPSCSAFAAGAIREHGALRGTALAIRRVGRCHPWQAGGYDPVPRRGA